MEPTTSVEYIRLFMNYVEQSGLKAKAIFQKTGFDSSVLNLDGVRISIEEFGLLWDTAVEESRDADLGLHVGEKLLYFPGHIVFLLMLNSPTVRNALQRFCRYYNLLTSVTTPCFVEHDERAELIVTYNTQGHPSGRHANEALLAAYASVLNRVSENRIRFEGVYFAHPKPANTREHQRIFNAPLYFNKKNNRLVFKSHYLNQPIVLSNKDISKNLEKIACNLQDRLFSLGPWSRKVSELLAAAQTVDEFDFAAVARKLAFSPRTLQNHLQNEGVTYTKLLEKIRKDQAVHLLKYSDVSISEIASLLGYSEQSALNRAFKQWMGVSPGRYRSGFRDSRPEPGREKV